MGKFLSMLVSVVSGTSFEKNGMTAWTMSVGDMEPPDTTFGEIFAYLQNVDLPCLMAIDEFQQITEYADENIEAALRTHVQYCSNSKFVFSALLIIGGKVVSLPPLPAPLQNGARTFEGMKNNRDMKVPKVTEVKNLIWEKYYY